tara:strand:+ start:1794 stop:2981 length:1188 start_codon:yes stop_codon:yes gene_type:complete
MKTFFAASSTCFVLLLLLFSSLIKAQDSQTPLVSLSPSKGLWIETPDEEMGLQLGFRLQQQLAVTAPLSSEQSPQTEFLIRRARLQLKGYLFQKELNYFIQLGMDKGQVTLLNAEYQWKPDSYTQLSIGQFFPPAGRQFQTSSKSFQLVDRSNVTRFFFTDWDLGIFLRRSILIGETMAVKTAASITHGEGKNVATAPGNWAYTGRFELLPFGTFNAEGDYSESDLFGEPSPKLSLGTAYYLNKDAYTQYGNTAWEGLDDNISEYYFDMVFKYNRFSFLAEYIHRSVENERLQESPTAEIFSNKVSGEGFYIQGGKFISKNLEPTFRISILNPNDEAQASKSAFIFQEKYVVGLNNFIEGHSIKFQTQVGLVNENFLNQQTRTYIEVLAQFSISF